MELEVEVNDAVLTLTFISNLIPSIVIVSGRRVLRFVTNGSATFRHQPFGRQYDFGHMGDKSVDEMG